MKRKMSLSEAAQALGLSINGMRARARKRPSLYGLERDNENRIWLVFDPDLVDGVEPVRPSRTLREPSNEVASEVLQARLDAAERARDVAESERDRWRALAETLAARRRWWPF